MMNDNAQSVDVVAAAVQHGKSASDSAKGGGVFKIECFDKDGNLKWESEVHNLVVSVGLQDMNSKYFTGSSYTAAWYLGLYGPSASNNPAASDTMGSHAGWVEITAYSQATRPVCSFGTATTASPSVITSSGSPATFSINGTATIGGAFLTSNNTKGGTAGTLFSAADFGAPGDRSVVSGDTLLVSYTFTLSAG